jgi:hypothetical protein
MRVLRGTPIDGGSRCLRGGDVRGRGPGAIVSATLHDRFTESDLSTITASPPSGRRRAKKKPSCQTCYFGIRMLCALELGGPCSTFRPDSPHGLTPPAQPMLLIGAEGAVLEPEPFEPAPLAA